MTVRLKIQKLDHRHKGFGKFSHRVEVDGHVLDLFTKFKEIRDWCWTNWNPSCEREMYLDMIAQTVLKSPSTRALLPQHWAWHYDADSRDCYIYLVSEADLNMFMLKWN